MKKEIVSQVATATSDSALWNMSWEPILRWPRLAHGPFIFSPLWWAHEHVFSQVFLGSSFWNVIDPKQEGGYAMQAQESLWLSLSKLVQVCAAPVTIAAARKVGEGQEDLKWCSRGVWCPRCPRSHAFLLITACLLTLTVCHSHLQSCVFRKHHPGRALCLDLALRTSLQAPLRDFQNLFRAINLVLSLLAYSSCDS